MSFRLRSVFAAEVQQQLPDYCVALDSTANRRAGFASKAEDCSREIKDLPRFAQAPTEAPRQASDMARAQAAALAQAHWKL